MDFGVVKSVRTKFLMAVLVMLVAVPFSEAAARGARSLPPSGRGLGSRVVAPQARTAEDVLSVRPSSLGLPSDRPLDFVIHVIDGDTVRLRERGVVRLIGVDTPETKHPRKPIQRCGPEASAFTRAAIEKRWVTLEQDREARDKYGRWLAYLHRAPDGFFLNAEIVRQGAGRAYTYFPFRLKGWFVELEEAAKRDALGIWGPKRSCDLPEAVVAIALPIEVQPVAAPPPVMAEAPQANIPPSEPAPAAQRSGKQAPAESAHPNPPTPRSAEPAQKTPAASPDSAVRRAPAPPSGHKPGCDIKGNINGEDRIYHLPGGNHYGRTKIDEDQGERWFCSAAEAEQAGWRKARN
jgi:micrococcal nuclease